ncbi:MAG: hypothetical protein A2020_14725 [Lentisphaerae bacterium GWF2_45_14]|nr:MAG: hypothetical protein A2020_14725 [Lentisphaerae bacterium GWF2_45_14]
MKRESTEWCQFYWYETSRSDLPRVLLIGDSIIVGSAPEVASILKGRVNIGFYSTSKIVGDPAIYRELALALGEYEPDIIYFNNGLHGRDCDIDFYRDGLEQFVDYLQLASKAKFVWRNSTPITVKDKPEDLDMRPDGNPLVIERNNVAAKIMEKYGVPVDDVYSLLVSHSEYSSGDGFHYNQTGWKFIAGHIADTIRKSLE